MEIKLSLITNIKTVRGLPRSSSQYGVTNYISVSLSRNVVTLKLSE
jgi:hypothetical protein